VAYLLKLDTYMLHSARYQELGHPTFPIFIFWRVIIISMNPEDIKVWSLNFASKGQTL